MTETMRKSLWLALLLAAGTALTPALAALPPGTGASGAFLIGRHALRLGDTATAADAMQSALQQDPDEAQLMPRAFQLLISEGRYEAAWAVADRAGARLRADGTTAIALAVRDAAAGRLAEAERRLQRIAEGGLAGTVRHMLLAWVQAGLGRSAEARATLELLKGDQNFGLLHFVHLGLMSELLNDVDAAAEAFRQAIDGVEQLPYRLGLAAGAFYERQGRAGDAEALYERLRRENPDSQLTQALLARRAKGEPPPRLVTKAADGMAEVMVDLASALRRERGSDLSLLYARLALALQPGMEIARLLVAEAYDDQQQYAAALALYQSLTDSPSYGYAAQLGAVEALVGLKRSDEAAALLEQMALARPDLPDPLVRLGDLMRTGKRWLDAAAAYDRALARIASPAQRHWSLFYSRGIAHERSKQWAKAEADFHRALELEADQPFVLNYLGYSWADQGIRLDEAAEMIERAVARRPRDGYIVDSLGWVLYRASRYEDAVRQLERAVELRPNDPTINDHLGDAYWKVGRHREALFQWRRVLVLEHDDTDDLLARAEAKIRGEGRP
ncbi:MAG: tetratricopeptide repeat protein [Thalassobaculales bacterium]